MSLRYTRPTLMLGRRPLRGTVPAFQALGTTATGFASTSAPGFPAVVINDIGLLSVGSDGSGVITCPAGWQPVGNGQVAVDAGFSAAAFWRRMDGTETGTVTVTRSVAAANLFFGARITTYRGCVPDGVPFETATATTGTSTTATGPALATSGVNRLAVTLWAWGNAGVSTADAAWTVVYQVNSTAGDDGSLAAERLTATTPQRIAAPSRTLTGSEPYVAFGLALLPP